MDLLLNSTDVDIAALPVNNNKGIYSPAIEAACKIAVRSAMVGLFFGTTWREWIKGCLKQAEACNAGR